MAEAVRFYWFTGQATLPLDAIPKRDRNPLLVRRTVVQAHAPEVLKALEVGRFVAAAWESAGTISMILCHPNLAKGPTDTVLVNTPTLPRVVLRLGSWSEAVDVSRLFLRAFGSEAQSNEEVTEARRDLVKWLEEHGQPQMAAVVNHFPAFPFGVRSDALEVINLWRHVLVKGEKREIDRFLDEVGRRFAARGWTRERTVEERLNREPHQINRFYCWNRRVDGRPQVTLCLNRATDRRVRSGTYDLHDEPTGISDLDSEIQHVLGEVLEPAANAVGLQVSYPRLGPISRVEPGTAAAMTNLAEAGDGQYPLPEPMQSLWRKFVHTAYQEAVAFHPEELTAWFMASGWDKEAATELTNQFYRDVALLEEYEEAGRQTA